VSPGRKDRILIVEDEKLIRMTLRERLHRQGYEVLEAETGGVALERLDGDDPDLMLLDYRLPDIDGIEVLRRTRQKREDINVILMTAFSTVDSAVAALKLGAYDYVRKPIDHDALIASIAKALETTRLRREVRRLRSVQRQRNGFSDLIGASEVMRQVFAMIAKVAGSAGTTVLIQGESGTGKDLVAKAIHFSSDRADKPFVNITCSALPETLLESELFGHEQGSFTDAKRLRKGLLELADEGTVFLDEIGDMGLTLQAKLLRFLEERAFRRVGGGRDVSVDVRVIAATNRRLDRAVAEGAFREDLYYRLKVVPIQLPPLRERKDDIPLLVEHFISKYNREFKKATAGVTERALQLLQSYDWPGNVRELRNVIERAMLLEHRERLDVQDLSGGILRRRGNGSGDSVAASRNGRVVELPDRGVSLRVVEKELVAQALEHADGNQSRAARLLQISRDALRYKMKKHGLA